MKKIVMAAVSAVLVSVLCLTAFAETAFTPSATQKDAPKATVSQNYNEAFKPVNKGSASSIPVPTAVLEDISAALKKLGSDFVVGHTTEALASEDTAVLEARKNKVAEATTQITNEVESKGKAEFFTNTMDITSNLKTINEEKGSNFTAENAVISDVLEIDPGEEIKSYMAEYGLGMTVNLDLQLNSEEKVIVCTLNEETGKWEALDPENIIYKDDGSIDATFNYFCPVVIIKLVEAEAPVVAPKAQFNWWWVILAAAAVGAAVTYMAAKKHKTSEK